LLSDLLAFRDEPLLRAVLPKAADDVHREILKARAFFSYGKERSYWGHAEEFLDLVDAAVANEGKGHHAAELITAMLGGVVRYPDGRAREENGAYHDGVNLPSVAALGRAARLAVLSDCWAFLRGADLRDERWLPYVKWKNALTADDTVLTFNYDAVPELLKASALDLHIVTPQQAADPFVAAVPGTRVIKLHGSTTWALRESDFAESASGDPISLLDSRYEPLMGFPGPGKMTTCNGRLKTLWGMGMQSIREAREVVFIGYRFPPTDTFAKVKILDALRDARRGKQLHVEIVLGTDQTVAVERMKELLGSAVNSLDIRVRNLFAEDYLILPRSDI
jgi:hypothetical protein